MSDGFPCVELKSEQLDLSYKRIHKLVFGEEHSYDGDAFPSIPSPGDNNSIGSTSGETKNSWDDPLFGIFHHKDNPRLTNEIGDPWVPSIAANNSWQDSLHDSLHDSLNDSTQAKSTQKFEFVSSDSLEPDISSMLSEIGNEEQCFSSDTSFAEISVKHIHGISNNNVHDDKFVNLYHTEIEFQEMMSSVTDPVGKFLKSSQLSAQDAVELNLHTKLLTAPKTPRTKYGKRRFISKEERYAIQKERNRIHARATRSRRKLFKEVLKARDEALSKSSQSENQSMASSNQVIDRKDASYRQFSSS